MLKILKSRVATKYTQPGRQAKHTGKSGFISTQPRGGAPIPYSFFEEVSSNIYPSVRDYVPSDYRKYADSYYDLRNEKYEYWYKRWGKPTIDKYMTWWKHGYAKIQEELQAQQKKTRKFSYSRTQFYSRFSRKCHIKCNCNLFSKHFCGRKCFLKYRGTRQRPNYKRRSLHGNRYYRFQYKSYSR